MTLPEGYETKVGERGVKLSGGQRQRIAIARALLHDTPILVLDEATSSLDAASERYVQNVIDLLIKQHKTIIVVTHRLTTACNADHIVVLDKGRVIEEGSHQDMISAKNYYYKLWRKQFEGINL